MGDANGVDISDLPAPDAPAPASSVANFSAALPQTPSIDDLPAPTAFDLSKLQPTLSYTPEGPINVAPPEPGSDDQIHKMMDNLSKSNLVSGNERGVLEGYLKSVVAPWEALGTVATGMVAKPVSDIAGLAAKAYDKVTGAQNGDPENFKNFVQEGLTYTPRTPEGRAIVGTIGQVGDATVGAAARFAADRLAKVAEAAGAPPDLIDRVYSGSEEAIQQAVGFIGLHAARGAGGELKYPVITPGDSALGYDGAATAKLPKADSIDRLLDAPDTKHEGAGAEPAPKAEPAAPAPTGAAPATPTEAPTPTENARTSQLVADLGSKQGGKIGVKVPETEAPDADFTPKESGDLKLNGGTDHPMRSGVPYTTMSGELSTNTPEQNDEAHTKLGELLKKSGLIYAPTIGAHEGTPEKSYAVQTPGDLDREKAENIGKTFGQESVMHVDADKNARIKYSDGRPDTDLGKMTPVTQEEALKAPGYTRDANGNYYVAKQPDTAAEPAAEPEHVPGTESEQRNGLGDNPEQGFKSLYGPPHKFGSTELEPTPEGQANRIATYQRLGIDEVPNSAVTGDYNDAGTEHQTSLLKNPMGQRIASVIDANRQAVRGHADSLIPMTGGSRGLEGATYERGQKMEAPVRGLQDHLDDSMDKAYDEAKRLGQGRMVPLTNLENALNNETSQFELVEGGPQLLKGIQTRMKELKLLGPKGEMLPATVEQADALRKSIGNAYQPKFGALISGLKHVIDDDVGNAVGRDVFAKPREIRTLISNILEQPEGVSKLLQATKGNKLGLNRQVALPDVPRYVKNLDPDQFRHYVSVLKQAGQAGVPKLRKQARAALAEVRAQFANEYLAAGDRQKGQWDQPSANKYLKQNELNMRHVFEPAEMQQFVDNDNAGRWLSKDPRYPGAEAQKQNMTSHAIEVGGKAASHGVGTVAGTGAGFALGDTVGGMVGSAAGQAVGSLVGKLANNIVAKQAEKMITKIPPAASKPLGAKIPGQLGAIGGVGRQSNAGMRSKQGGGALKLKTQDLVNDAIPPRDTRGWGPHEKIIDELLEGFGRPQGSVANPTRAAAIRDEAKQLSGEKSERGEIIRDLLKADPNKEESYEHVDRAIGYLNNYENNMLRAPKLPPARESSAPTKKAAPAPAPSLPAKLSGGMTAPERAQLRANTTKRVIDAFHELGDNMTPELAAAALAGQAKRGWYRRSAEAITNLFGPDAPRFAGVLAAMSPQTSVEMNLHNAIRTFINWDKAGRPEDPGKIEAIMRKSVQKARPEDPGVLHAWVPNTIRALTHPNPENLPIPVNPAAQPSAKVRAVADKYMKSTGREYDRPEPTQVDPARGKAIADAYEAMEHKPNDPKVKASYDAMIKETMAQYQAMKKSGLKVEFFPDSGKDPYEGNPRAAIDDIQKNNHLYVYPTKDGFGSTAGPTDNPLLADSGEKFGKTPATQNDIFRAVHDYFGHAADGNGFRATGEENAWRQHAAMYSNLARPAMTTETRGQNSWVNFGPHGDVNRTAKQGETTYADQKTGLLPKEFSDPKNVGKDELQLSGPKVNSFMKNLRDNVNEVTLDAWMSTFANIDPARLAGSGNLSGPGKSPTYLAYSAHVRNAAAMLTQLTGEKWTPAEVQETVWSFAKTAYEYAEKHGISIQQAMKSGAITDDLIRSTPDFHTLFSSPEHAGFIQSSRYAGNAKQLATGQSQSANAANTSQTRATAQEALRPNLVSATKRLDKVLENKRRAKRGQGAAPEAIDMGGKLMSSDSDEAPF